MADKSVLNVRIDPDFKERARLLADEDGRTLSNWLLRIIEDQIAEADRHALPRADRHSGLLTDNK